MKVLIITGDRNATRYAPDRLKWTAVMRSAFETIRSSMAPHDAVLLIHGACGMDGWTGTMKGIDAIAHDVAAEFGFIVIPMPADWARHGYAAGPIRNRAMIEVARKLRTAGADVHCLAFHDNVGFSKGTKHCMDEAGRHGIHTVLTQSSGAFRQVAA